jgi:hypothetical protein
LNIELIVSKIHTSAFQKSLNLYHYLPPRFSHPPSCLIGLRAGEMMRYFIQSSQEGFESILEKFIIRLMERSNQLKNIIPILQKKLYNLTTYTLSKPLKPTPTLCTYTKYITHMAYRGMTSENFSTKSWNPYLILIE